MIITDGTGRPETFDLGEVVNKAVWRVAIGLVMLMVSAPLIDLSHLFQDGTNSAYAFKYLGGADKIGWARKYRAWCAKHTDEASCAYVNSVKYPKCVKSAVKNFKNACSAAG